MGLREWKSTTESFAMDVPAVDAGSTLPTTLHCQTRFKALAGDTTGFLIAVPSLMPVARGGRMLGIETTGLMGWLLVVSLAMFMNELMSSRSTSTSSSDTTSM